MNSLSRLAIRATLPFQRRWLAQRVGRLVLETVEGLPVVVLPTVFNPAVFGSSDVLVRALRQLAALRADKGGRVLDMGTGSGVGAVAAARLGYDVLAVDCNADAVRCAQINALVNDVGPRVRALQGDVFASIGHQRFDIVLFNPPFFEGEPRSELDRAWRSTDVLERFANGLPDALAEDGEALVVVSSHGGRERTEMGLRSAGLVLQPFLVSDLGYEIVTVLRVSRGTHHQ